MRVLKIGGNVINNPATLHEALDYFAATVEPAVLVHGGGRKAGEVIRQLGHEPVLIDGRRITDHATLDIVTMVYAGLLNKNIVAQLQARGTNAIGLSGADANAVLAEKRPVGDIDYGFAGDITAVNAPLLEALLKLGLRPVLCAITHDAHGQLLNTNADTIATHTALAMSRQGHEVSLQFCFDLPGVLTDIDDHNSVIPHITPDSYKELLANGTITDGMRPKLDNAMEALAAGVREIRIGNLTSLRNASATRLTPTP